VGGADHQTVETLLNTSIPVRNNAVFIPGGSRFSGAHIAAEVVHAHMICSWRGGPSLRFFLEPE
jgi:hypothetical protein